VENIKTVAGRDRLPPRREPHWERLAAGQHIGYRKAQSGHGTWIARHRDADTGTITTKPLGSFDDVPGNTRFDAAASVAREHFKHINSGGITTPKTVGDACSEYVKHTKTEHGDKAAADVAARYARFITGTKFEQIELQKLTPPTVQAWAAGMRSRKARQGGKDAKHTFTTDRPISATTYNRDIAAVRAALNHAFGQSWVTSDSAWKVKLKPVKEAGNRRELYLGRDQRQALIDAVEKLGSGVAPFVRALCSLPVRPGALAALTVADWDPRLGQLSIKLDKTGSRQFTLPTNIAAVFNEACRDKTKAAPIFARPDGGSWGKDDWKGPIKAAAKAAGLPDDVVAYTLRHTAITDLVRGGLDLMTVGQISGTSIAMIQKHYGQHSPTAATTSLAALAM
jgi:integrase